MAPCLVPHHVWKNPEVRKHIQKGALYEAYMTCRQGDEKDLKLRMNNYIAQKHQATVHYKDMDLCISLCRS